MATKEKRAKLKTLIHKLMKQPKNVRYTSNGHTGALCSHSHTGGCYACEKHTDAFGDAHNQQHHWVNKLCPFDEFNRIEPLEIQYFRKFNDHFMGSNLLNGVSIAVRMIQTIPKINSGHNTYCRYEYSLNKLPRLSISACQRLTFQISANCLAYHSTDIENQFLANLIRWCIIRLCDTKFALTFSIETVFDRCDIARWL